MVLAVTQPLRIGDLVTFEGETGTVEDVSLTYTWLRTGSDARLIIPNERLAAGVLRNDSIRSPTVALEVSAWLAPEADETAALAAVGALEETQSARIAEVTDTGLRLQVAGPPGAPGRAHRARRRASRRGPAGTARSRVSGTPRRTLIYPSRVPMSRRERQRRTRRHHKGGASRVIFVFLGLLVTGAIIAGIAAVGWVINVANSAPSLDTRKPIELGATSRVYAADGKTRLGFINANILRTPVTSNRDPGHRARGDGGHRGPALLRAPGRGLRGHRPRRSEEPRVQEGHPGRLDADHAARAQPLHGRARAQRRGRLQAQDPRGQAGPGARGSPSRAPRQAVDRQQVRQLGALRHRRRPDRGRHPGRRAHLLRQARLAADAARGGAAGRAARRRRRTTTRSSTRAPPPRGATTCCSGWPTRATSPRPRPTRRSR